MTDLYGLPGHPCRQDLSRAQRLADRRPQKKDRRAADRALIVPVSARRGFVETGRMNLCRRTAVIRRQVKRFAAIAAERVPGRESGLYGQVASSKSRSSQRYRRRRSGPERTYRRHEMCSSICTGRLPVRMSLRNHDLTGWIARRPVLAAGLMIRPWQNVGDVCSMLLYKPQFFINHRGRRMQWRRRC